MKEQTEKKLAKLEKMERELYEMQDKVQKTAEARDQIEGFLRQGSIKLVDNDHIEVVRDPLE